MLDRVFGAKILRESVWTAPPDHRRRAVHPDSLVFHSSTPLGELYGQPRRAASTCNPPDATGSARLPPLPGCATLADDGEIRCGSATLPGTSRRAGHADSSMTIV